MEELIEATIKRNMAIRALYWALDELRRKCHEDSQIAEYMRDVWKSQNSGAEL